MQSNLGGCGQSVRHRAKTHDAANLAEDVYFAFVRFTVPQELIESELAGQQHSYLVEVEFETAGDTLLPFVSPVDDVLFVGEVVPHDSPPFVLWK